MTDSGHTKSLTRTREASTVLVTGAASGIGAAIAAELAEAGGSRDSTCALPAPSCPALAT